MPTRIKPIPLRKDEDKILRRFYVQSRIGRGQYKKHPDYLAVLTDMFNRFTGNSYSPTQIYHYIETQQKITARLDEPWPTFKGAHKRLPPLDVVLTAAHMIVLREIWMECIVPLELGTDAVCYREDVVMLLEREFKRRTGTLVPGMLLASIVETARKRRDWLRLKDVKDGFNDLDKLG